MTTRREFLLLASGLTAANAYATPEEMRAALRKVVGGAQVRRGRVKLDLPPLIDNGNSVTLSVSVASPMTPAEHVKAIHLFTEKNPQPYVLSAYFGPRSGEARVSTRIRLADSQTVHAVALMNDGSLWSDSVEVIVTLSACLGDLI